MVENSRGTRVSLLRLKFERIEFYFFFFLAFKVLLCADKTTQHSIRSFLFFVKSFKTTQRSIRSFYFVRSFVSVHPAFVSVAFVSVLCQIVPSSFFLFFRCEVLQVPKSSLRNSFLLLELESYRLEIYLA